MMLKIRTYHLVLFLPLLLSARTMLVTNADEVKRAMKSAAPGDTVMLRSGVWTDERIQCSANGTKDQPVVLMAERAGSVMLTGTSQLRFSGEWIVVQGLLFSGGAIEGKKGAVIEFRTSSKEEASHARLTECAIVDYNPQDKWLDYKWVSVYGRENRVDHCTFLNKRHQGTLLVVWLDSLPGRHRIDHNYFGPRPVHGENGAETIRIGTSEWSMFSSATMVENNYFYSCDGEVEIISNKSCNNVYRWNTFVECAGTLTLRHGNRTEVYGNHFFGRQKKNSGGVRVIGEDQKVHDNYFDGLAGEKQFSAMSFMLGVKDSPANGYFQVKRAEVRNNTFVDCKSVLLLGVVGSNPAADLPPEASSITKNLILRNSGTLLSAPVPSEQISIAGNVSDGPSPAGLANSQVRSADVAITKGEDNVWRPTAVVAAGMGPEALLRHPVSAGETGSPWYTNTK